MSLEQKPDVLSDRGPMIYENWLSKHQDVPIPATYEYVLYTDAWITGEVTDGLGPYQLLNGLDFRQDNSIRAGIVLRVDVYEIIEESESEWKTDASSYHGGTIEDEIAALVSLSLGIRVRAGEMTRDFVINSDPRGRPRGSIGGLTPTLLRRHSGDRFILPKAIGDHCLNEMVLLPKLPLLHPADATALVIAARSYQNAVWIAEAEPELAWLLMISAIETAAVHWKAGSDTPSQRLQISNQKLYDLLLACGGAKHVEEVALIIADSFQSTNKFIKFMTAYLPDPPPNRPAAFCQVDWSEASMKKMLSTIYGHRSKALHTGIPFPAPMCMCSSHMGEETLLGSSARTMGATWERKDAPMLLHTFEYIVRNVLLKWWASMLPKTSVASNAEKTIQAITNDSSQ